MFFVAQIQIPAGVLVATNYDEAGIDWNNLPVRPIIHSGDWGLFEVLESYQAPFTGACITIVESDSSQTFTQITRVELDSLLGIDNWTCFPDKEDGIAIKKLPASLVVSSPLAKIETYEEIVTSGDAITKPNIGGTADLEINHRLPRSECPANQQAALANWDIERNSDLEIMTAARLNLVFGEGAWSCLPWETSVRINVGQSSFVLGYPFTVVDDDKGLRYGVGDTIPSGLQFTVWLAKALPKSQCP